MPVSSNRLGPLPISNDVFLRLIFTCVHQAQQGIIKNQHIMSEIRTADLIITKYVPDHGGKRRRTKYELFAARQFATNWKPSRRNFHPQPALSTEQRQEYWRSMYRVRINGKWYGKTKYSFFSLADVATLCGLLA